MPRRSRPVYCTCAQCCKAAVSSIGLLFPNSINRSAHLARLKSQDSPQNEIDSEVFLDTFANVGPLQGGFSKLWTSRDAFQQVITESSLPADQQVTHDLSPLVDGLPLSVDDIVASMSRLALGTQPVITDPALSTDHSLGLQQQPVVPRSYKRSMHKRERTRSTQKCLELLDNMKMRIAVAQTKLTDLSHATLCEVEAEAEAVRRAWTQITRRTSSVDSRRAEVLEVLNILDVRLTELRLAIPDTRRNPLGFDTS